MTGLEIYYVLCLAFTGMFVTFVLGAMYVLSKTEVISETELET